MTVFYLNDVHSTNNSTDKLQGTSPNRIRHLAVLLVSSLKFTSVEMIGPNKSI